MKETAAPPLVDEEELARSFEALGEARMVPILRAFGACAMDEARAIAAALTGGDEDHARRLAHGFKGAAGNMSATRLASAAEGIEKAASPIPAEAVLPPLLDAARQTAEWIAHRFPD